MPAILPMLARAAQVLDEARSVGQGREPVDCLQDVREKHFTRDRAPRRQVETLHKSFELLKPGEAELVRLRTVEARWLQRGPVRLRLTHAPVEISSSASHVGSSGDVVHDGDDALEPCNFGLEPAGWTAVTGAGQLGRDRQLIKGRSSGHTSRPLPDVALAPCGTANASLRGWRWHSRGQA